MLASTLNFEQSFLKLIAPVGRVLEASAHNLAAVRKCEGILQRIGSAVLQNSSVEREAFLKTLYALCKGGLLADEDERKLETRADVSM